MSTFEGLPLELRNMIYGYCLIHQSEIDPCSTGHKKAKGTVAAGELDFRTNEGNGQAAFGERKGTEELDRIPGRGTQRYAERWPCIALLGVSTIIQEEAAVVLFGKNSWYVIEYSKYLILDTFRPIKSC